MNNLVINHDRSTNVNLFFLWQLFEQKLKLKFSWHSLEPGLSDKSCRLTQSPSNPSNHHQYRWLDILLTCETGKQLQEVKLTLTEHNLRTRTRGSDRTFSCTGPAVFLKQGGSGGWCKPPPPRQAAVAACHATLLRVSSAGTRCAVSLTLPVVAFTLLVTKGKNSQTHVVMVTASLPW